MTRSRSLLLATVAAALIVTPTLSQAATSPQSVAKEVAKTVRPAGDGVTAAFDSRAGLAALAPTSAQRSAVAKIKGATATWNTSGTPRSISVPGGALTGPRAGDPLAIAKSWLSANSAAFGLTATDMAALAVVRNHTLPGVNARVLSFAQTFNGIESGYGAILTVLVDRHGRVVSYTGNPVRTSTLKGSFDLSMGQAVTRTVGDLLGLAFTATATGGTQGGYTVYERGVLADVVRVRKIAFPTSTGGRAAYAVLVVKSAEEAWAVIIDAATGKPLLRQSLVAHDAEGTVYENYPGAAKGGEPVVKSFGPTPESPGGWVDPTGLAGTGVTTFGNNANAVIAWTAPLVPADQYNRPVNPLGEFHYDFPDQWAKSRGATGSFQADAMAAVTNLFYHHNRIHDELYKFGFTETGGNFQLSNFGKGGLEGDAILGGAQSGAVGGAPPVSLGRNNANMLTLPDGIPGATNMYLWEPVDDAFEGPYRDGDFDATIIQHEYSHGLSNRYVGGGGLGSLGGTQSGSMGEGWGDWYAMNHLFREGLTRTAVTAPYVGDPLRGIRNYNYATNPTTYGDFGYDLNGPEVHSDGEIWTASLWTMRTAILKSVNGDQRAASDIAEHLVTDAMPISPPAPSFLDMRDAILKASELRYGNKYTDLLWDAFASRGMGASAKTKSADDTDPVPGFDNKNPKLNGKLKLKLVNASAGGRVKDARVFAGLFEARATPFDTTNRKGRASAKMADGRYTLTVQAAGFGIQRFPVKIAKGKTTKKVVELRPNLLSESAGAKIVKVTSENPALTAEGIMDDSEASAWQTGKSAKAYDAGPDQSVTIKLAKPATIETVSVSVMKPPTFPRFASADKVLVQTSKNGKTWKTATTATFTFKLPRPNVADQRLKTYQLRKPVKAKFVRAVVASNFGTGATNASTALVAEVQAFGKVKNLKPKPAKPDAPVTEHGMVATGNTAQGALLLPPTEPYRDGVTTGSWKASCPGLPPANGVDAWITKLPKGSADGKHAITYKGDVPIGEWLLYWYTPDCVPITGDFGYTDESVTVPPGAGYAGFLLLYGGGADFDVTVSEPR